MSNFDAKYWNLSQAAAWVVYRNRELVEEFSKQSAQHWGALLIYPKKEYTAVGKLDDLVDALTRKKLTAWGRRNGIKDDLEAIPAREWNDLWISPPSAKRSHPTAGQIEPWTDLRFESSDLKKRWRSLSEIEGRTTFNWKVAEEMWHEIVKLHPKFSDNQIIEELKLAYEEEFGKGKAPGRTTIQDRIKRWKASQPV